MILCKDFQYMYSLPRNGAEQVWLFALRKLGNKVSKKTDLNIFLVLIVNALLSFSYSSWLKPFETM